MPQLTETTITDDLAEAQAKLQEVRQLLESLEDAPPALREAAARLARLEADVARVGRVVDAQLN